MTKEEFFQKAVMPDVSWYTKNAKTYRTCHFASRILVILFSSFTAFLASQDCCDKDIIIAVLSALVVIITAISELMKFKEQWTEYRTTCERLKREVNLFETSTEPYNCENSFNVFVKNFEQIKEDEHGKWRTYITEK